MSWRIDETAAIPDNHRIRHSSLGLPVLGHIRWSSRWLWAILIGLTVLAASAYFGGRYLWARQHLYTAKKALDVGDLDLAQEELDQCLSVWPDRADLHLLAVKTARRRDDFDKAAHHLSVLDQ